MSEKRGFFDRLKEQIIEKPDVEPTKEVPQNSFTTQPGFSPSFTHNQISHHHNLVWCQVIFNVSWMNNSPTI
jgi:hypothetical protein